MGLKISGRDATLIRPQVAPQAQLAPPHVVAPKARPSMQRIHAVGLTVNSTTRIIKRDAAVRLRPPLGGVAQMVRAWDS